jgi:hypothetical protein
MISLRYRIQPQIKAVRFDGLLCSVVKIAEMVGEHFEVTLRKDKLKISSIDGEFNIMVKPNNYVILENEKLIRVFSVKRLLERYQAIDVDQDELLQRHQEESISAKAKFFSDMKEMLS